MPIDKLALGVKLKRCRDNLNLELSEIANKTGLDKDRLQEIETGTAEPTGDEILILADYYKQDYKYFISNEKISASENIEILYRKHGNEFSKEDRAAIQEFIFLCENEESMYKFLEINSLDFKVPNYKKIYKNQGIEVANNLRKRLGYSGREVYNDIYSEFRKLGIHIFRRKLNNSTISGLFIKHPIAGKCILVNYTEDIYRQNFTIAHEVGHALMDNELDYNISFTNESNYREYRANAFASSFLVPQDVFEKYDNITWTKEIIINLANQLRVNVLTLTIALLNYNKMSKEEFDIFKNIKVPKQEKDDFELSNLTEKRISTKKLVLDRGLSEYYVKVCHESYMRGFISSGKLAEMLLADNIELEMILNSFNLKVNYEH